MIRIKSAFETNKAIEHGLNTILYNNGYGRERLLSRDKYLAILSSISSYVFQIYSEKYLDERYKQYESFCYDPDGYVTGLVRNTFLEILNTKELIRKMLFWIFDFSVPEFSHLTIYQRAYLYDIVFNANIENILDIEKNYSFGASEDRGIPAFMDFPDEEDQIKVFHLYKNDYTLNTENNIPVPEVLTNLIDEVQKRTSGSIRETCTIDSLEQLLKLELMDMFNQNIIVKKCKYCGNYFIAENMKNEYCNGYAKNEVKPCSEIGSTRTYQNRIKKDEIYAIYQRAYKTHFARIKKGKMTQAAFSTWSIESKQKMADAREGRLSMEEYVAWLKV